MTYLLTDTMEVPKPLPQKPCPICEKDRTHFARYPDAVCPSCAECTVSENNVPIIFGNTSAWGGFVFYINGVKGDVHECQIQGPSQMVPCYAQEARFGGIVISVVL